MYKGQLKFFPHEVVEKMLERQVEQGNSRDLAVLEDRVYPTKKEGGFDWDATIEGDDFWENVICGKNFSLFFERYPRQVITNETSKEAYATLDASGIREKILSFFKERGYGTQDNVAEAIGLDRNQVHKRLSEIPDLQETCIAVKSPVTGKLCKIWAIKGIHTINLKVG